MIGVLAAEAYEISEEDFFSGSHKPLYVDARRVATYVARHLGYTYEQIGTGINRHHATVISLYNSYNDLAPHTPRMQAARKHVMRQLRKITKATIQKMDEIKNRAVSFQPEPKLWPETWTDCFTVCSNSNSNNVDEAISEAVTNADVPSYERQGNHIFTDNQLLADELKDSLFGYEIAFRHTHIPEHYG